MYPCPLLFIHTELFDIALRRAVAALLNTPKAVIVAAAESLESMILGQWGGGGLLDKKE